MKSGIVLCCALLTTPAFANQMFEWKDPKTGKLMLGDKPPSDGTRFWPEGQRPHLETPSTIGPATPTNNAAQEGADRAARWAELNKKRQDVSRLMEAPKTGEPNAPTNADKIATLCNGLAPLARASAVAKQKGIPLAIAEIAAVPKTAALETANILKQVVRSVYNNNLTTENAEVIVVQACRLTYGGIR